jgi:acetyl-CoA carboxylase biotin carboxyl carrier protein
MPNVDEIAALVALAEQMGLARIEIETAAFSLRLEMMPRRPPAAGVPIARASRTRTVRTTTIGRFSPCAPLSALPFVSPGNVVSEGEIMGLLQIGALLRPIRTPVSGIVRAVHATEGAVLGYGAPVFDIETQ